MNNSIIYDRGTTGCYRAFSFDVCNYAGTNRHTHRSEYACCVLHIRRLFSAYTSPMVCIIMNNSIIYDRGTTGCYRAFSFDVCNYAGTNRHTHRLKYMFNLLHTQNYHLVSFKEFDTLTQI